MYRPVIAGAVIAFGFLGWPGAQSGAPAFELDAERMILEYDPAEDQVALLVSAESEVGLERVEVRDGTGHVLLRMRNYDGGSLGVYGFRVQKGAGNAATALGAYPEGVYQLWARTVDGQIATGDATLSHALLAAPVVTFPAYEASGVPAEDLRVSWLPQAGVRGYQVGLEQGETDLMVAQLGAGTSSFKVPQELLAPRTPYRIEVAAIGANGNITLVKIPFTTL